MKLLFHLHTKYSHDSFNSPYKIVDYCIKNKIDYLAITDHETIKGSLVAAEYAKKRNYQINIIIGAEYKTNAGDIIGLFLQKEYKEYDCISLINSIKLDGGIVILPHPFNGHKLTDEIVESVDIIETFNPRCSEMENFKAKQLALKFSKPEIAGADAHLFYELKNCLNLLNGNEIRASLFDDKIMKTKYTKKINFFISQFIKSIKRKKISIFISTLKSLISFYMVQPLRIIIKKI